MIDDQADVSWHFADLFAGTALEHLPSPAIEAAKKSLLDTVGVSLAGSGLEPAVGAVAQLVRQTGGRSEASVLGFGDRVPAIMAAFANGALSHCLDYDDQTPWGQHSASSLIPAVLAIAERVGGVPGREVIAAVAAGQDMFARLRCYVDWRKDWNLSSVVGVLGAAAACARILGMGSDGIHAALGIATQQSSGLGEVVAGTGSDLRGMYAGFTAKGAVLAALLAHQGVTGVESPFEGKYGLFNLYFGGRYDREEMLRDLRNDYRGSSTLYKMWPCVGTSHSHIHATIGLMTENDLSVGDIGEIRVHVGDYHLLMCRPLETRRAPRTLVDARFSLPFLVAVAAVRREISIGDISPAGRCAREVLAVAQRVIPVEDSTYDWQLDLPPGRVEIIMRDGRTLSAVGSGVPGSLEAPMTWDQLGRKFRECAAVAAHAPSPDRVDAAVDMVRNLETLEDISDVVRVLQ
jgi:2-methylcitrate dehydratase PrpD